jgi:putative transposase
VLPRCRKLPSEGFGCAERFIRALKENVLWVRTFGTVEDLRRALLEFRRPTTPAG